MALKIRKAVREQIYIKLALMGSRGCCKTYSSLRLATGMADELSKTLGRPAKILMANTEGSRGLYYANEFEYDIVDIEPPYNPEVFIELIDEAIKKDVLLSRQLR